LLSQNGISTNENAVRERALQPKVLGHQIIILLDKKKNAWSKKMGEIFEKKGEQFEKMGENLWKNKLVGYFLILWAATFFFSAISGFMYLADGYASALDVIVDGLWDLSEIGCAVILAMLGMRILSNK
jgi:hypothetical protein